MVTKNTTGNKAFTATAVAIEAGTRVVLGSGGTISAAAESSLCIGVTTEYIAASGTGNVQLFGNTMEVQAASAFACGAQLYTAAAGEVDDSGTYKIPYVAGQAATAQGDLVEIIPINDAYLAAAVYSAANFANVSAAGNSQATGTVISAAVNNVAAADDTTGVTLPTCAAGLQYTIINSVANKHLHIWPSASDQIYGLAQDAVMTLAASCSATFYGVDSRYWGVVQGAVAV